MNNRLRVEWRIKRLRDLADSNESIGMDSIAKNLRQEADTLEQEAKKTEDYLRAEVAAHMSKL